MQTKFNVNVIHVLMIISNVEHENELNFHMLTLFASIHKEAQNHVIHHTMA